MSKKLTLEILNTNLLHYKNILSDMGYGGLPKKQLDQDYKEVLKEVNNIKKSIKWIKSL